jgi:hypothetical protein
LKSCWQIGSICKVISLSTLTALSPSLKAQEKLSTPEGHLRVRQVLIDTQNRQEMRMKKDVYLPRHLRTSTESHLGLTLKRKMITPAASKRGMGQDLQRQDFDIHRNGKPVRGYFLAEIHDAKGHLVQALGSIPSLSVTVVESQATLPIEAIGQILQQDFAQKYRTINLESVNDVYWYDRLHTIYAAQELGLSLDERPYRAYLINGGVQGLVPLYFHATTGVAQVFAENPFDSPLTEAELPGLLGTGKLETAHIVTNPGGGNPSAESDTHRFIYDVEDPRFIEVNAFSHLLDFQQWYESLGYQWHTDGRLLLSLNQSLNGDTNNAYYQPNGGNPQIKIGSGDGKILQNLGLDADVVGHEFGHHILFQYLQSTSAEESLVLHEGLADFFTFAKTGNACLGESICPENSPVCEVRGQCLRTAENNILYSDPSYRSLMPHQKGQLISSILWDLKDMEDLDLNRVAKILFAAITFLPAESIIEDLFLSLLTADEILHAGKYSCAITDAFSARGFSMFTDLIDCTTVEPKETYVDASGTVDSTSIAQVRLPDGPGTENIASGAGTAGGAGSPKSRKSSGGGCGVIGGQAGQIVGLEYLLLLALPIVSRIKRRKSSQLRASLSSKLG